MKYQTTLAGLSIIALLCSAGSHASNLRIIGGSETTLDQYPFIAGLVYKGDDATSVFCGASVVAPQWILTAAHCVPQVLASDLQVILNTTDLKQIASAERIQATEIRIHPDYSLDSEANDIALIKLAKSTQVAPIRTASGADADTIKTGEPVSVAGWGDVSISDDPVPTKLRAVNVQISDFASCNAAYGNGLSDKQVCAGIPEGGKDSCKGDSGGPLIARTATGAVQVGIVSFGQSCALSDFPGVYTNVASYQNFLAESFASEPATDVPVTSSGEPVADLDPQIDEPDVNDSQSPLVQLTLLEPFENATAGKTAYAAVELYNPSQLMMTVSDIQLSNTNNEALFIEDENCTSEPLNPDEACYIDLEWIPQQDGSISETLSLGTSNGGSVSTQKLDIEALAQSLDEFGPAVDYPDGEFQTDHSNPWLVTDVNTLEGEDAIETTFDSDDEFWLTGAFDNEQDETLTFSYMLNGATCKIFIDGKPAYELTSSDDWENASIFLPKGSRVEWRFQGQERSANGGEIRLDNFRMDAAIPQQNQSASNSISDNDAGQFASAEGGGTAGGGSADLLSLIVLFSLFGVMCMRRTHTVQG